MGSWEHISADTPQADSNYMYHCTTWSVLKESLDLNKILMLIYYWCLSSNVGCLVACKILVAVLRCNYLQL